MMVKLSISIDITIGSFYEGATPLKSSSVKVMSDILDRKDIVFTCCVRMYDFKLEGGGVNGLKREFANFLV